MDMKDKLRQVLPEALLASMADNRTDITVLPGSDAAGINGRINLDTLAARLAQLAGIADIRMVPVTHTVSPREQAPLSTEYTPLVFGSLSYMDDAGSAPRNRAQLRLVPRSETNPDPAA